MVFVLEDFDYCYRFFFHRCLIETKKVVNVYGIQRYLRCSVERVGVRKGDEVIFPTLTHCYCCNMVTMTGVKTLMNHLINTKVGLIAPRSMFRTHRLSKCEKVLK